MRCVSSARTSSATRGGACALRMAIERPAAVGRLVLMGRRRGYDAWVADARPQASAELLQGRRPDIAKLATFIRGDLVYDGSLVSDATLQERFQSSIDPEVVASPPLLGPKGIPQFRKLDFTRDPRLAGVQNPTLVLWGTEDKVNRPSGAARCSGACRTATCTCSARPATGCRERADEFNAMVVAFLAEDGADAPVFRRV